MINLCKIVAKSICLEVYYQWINVLSGYLARPVFWNRVSISWGQFLFPGKILWSLLPLLLLRLDNVGTAGLKTTPNTLDWHLLPLFAGRLKVTYQGFDSHPDTYFMAGAEIKKLLSANLFQINQPNNLDLWIKSFLSFWLLEHCLNLDAKWYRNTYIESFKNNYRKNGYWFNLWDNCIERRQLVSEMSLRQWNLKYAKCKICEICGINAKGRLRNARDLSARETEKKDVRFEQIISLFLTII